jgi:hypothetical protein
MNHQDQTIQTYNVRFAEYKNTTPNEVSGEFKARLDKFAELLKADKNKKEAIGKASVKVFELGSAEGRDARYLRSLGLDIFCTDIISEGLRSLREDGFEVSEYDFRDLPDESLYGKFDAVLANAVYFMQQKKNFKIHL